MYANAPQETLQNELKGAIVDQREASTWGGCSFDLQVISS